MKAVKHQTKIQHQSDLVKSSIIESDLDDFIKIILKEMLEHYRRDIQWRYICHIPLRESVLSLFCDNNLGEITVEVVDPHKYEIKKIKTMNAADFVRFVGVVEGLVG